MQDTDAAAKAPAIEPADARAGPAWLIGRAPAPDLPHERDRTGARRGLAIALLGGGLFWGLVAVGFAYLIRR
jgi:hypothetical protein